MQGKYVLHCDVADPVRDLFLEVMKKNRRRYAIIYSKQADGSAVVTYNEIIFEEYEEFLDHVEGTSGGYDGLFGYSREATQ